MVIRMPITYNVVSMDIIYHLTISMIRLVSPPFTSIEMRLNSPIHIGFEEPPTSRGYDHSWNICMGYKNDETCCCQPHHFFPSHSPSTINRSRVSTNHHRVSFDILSNRFKCWTRKKKNSSELKCSRPCVYWRGYHNYQQSTYTTLHQHFKAGSVQSAMEHVQAYIGSRHQRIPSNQRFTRNFIQPYQRGRVKSQMQQVHGKYGNDHCHHSEIPESQCSRHLPGKFDSR